MAVSFCANNNNSPMIARDDRQKRNQELAVGIGGAGSTVAIARKVESTEKNIQKFFGAITSGASKLNKNSKAMTSLLGKFKYNMKVISDSVMAKVSKLQNTKVLGAIIKSPITRRMANGVGGVLAFFVLISGVNKAVNTGEVAVHDFRHKEGVFA